MNRIKICLGKHPLGFKTSRRQIVSLCPVGMMWDISPLETVEQFTTMDEQANSTVCFEIAGLINKFTITEIQSPQCV